MINRISTYALMLSITLWGVMLGGNVYSHLVYFPVFLSHLPESAVVVNGEYGLHEATFWMALHPVLLLSLIVSLAANWRHPFRRKMIALTLGVYIVVIVVSALYFIPELGRFASSPLKPEVTPVEWFDRGVRWLRLSWLRGLVCFANIVPLLLALAQPPRHVPASGPEASA